MIVVVVVGASAVGVDPHIVHKCVGVVVLISRYFDQVVPVHYRSYEVLQLVLLRLLLGIKVLANFEPFVLHFLGSPFSAIIEQAGALSLAFVSSNMALL